MAKKLEMEKEKVIKETKNKLLELFRPYVPQAVTSRI
jgi:hypothetical protein